MNYKKSSLPYLALTIIGLISTIVLDNRVEKESILEFEIIIPEAQSYQVKKVLPLKPKQSQFLIASQHSFHINELND